MDTLFRHWHMLRLLPRYPRKISTAEIESKLETSGFRTSRRTIQRDLDKLSVEFPLVSDGNKPSGWSWQVDADTFDIPGMDTNTALTFCMVQTYLKPLLPQGCLAALNPHLRRAEKLLKELEGCNLKAWPDKVRIVQRSQNLEPPRIASEVMGVVYEALFHDRQFLGEYRSRSERATKEFVVNPLGLIFHDPVVYLVATLWDYSDLRLLALHRFNTARLLKDGCRRPENFNLDHYLAQGAVEFPLNPNAGPIHLIVRMASDVAFHLRESPLGKKQKITPDQDGFVQIETTVANTCQLRWWLLGFGDKVEIIGPTDLRAEFTQTAKAMMNLYVPD